MIHFELVKGDITQQKVDVMVTAANQGLRGGGGVDGAIHYACGKGLLEECLALGGCSTGKAKITRAYDLTDKGTPWIIHAVGPRYAGGMYFEADLLADAYKSALDITTRPGEVYLEQCLEVLEQYIGHLEPSKQQPYIDETTEEVMAYVKAHPIASIAFPSISTGVYGYPLKEAVPIALRTLQRFCSRNRHLEKVMLVCYDNETYSAYKRML